MRQASALPSMIRRLLQASAAQSGSGILAAIRGGTRVAAAADASVTVEVGSGLALPVAGIGLATTLPADALAAPTSCWPPQALKTRAKAQAARVGEIEIFTVDSKKARLQ